MRKNCEDFMSKHERLIIHTDGGARGNPGPAGIGVVIKDKEGEIVAAYGRYIGKITNNQAEYKALISALEKAVELGAKEAGCFLDSELLVKQLNHEYKVRDEDLAPLFLQVWNLLNKFNKIIFKHIPRAKNKEADKLVNEAIDRHLRESK